MPSIRHSLCDLVFPFHICFALVFFLHFFVLTPDVFFLFWVLFFFFDWSILCFFPPLFRFLFSFLISLYHRLTWEHVDLLISLFRFRSFLLTFISVWYFFLFSFSFLFLFYLRSIPLWLCFLVYCLVRVRTIMFKPLLWSPLYCFSGIDNQIGIGQPRVSKDKTWLGSTASLVYDKGTPLFWFFFTGFFFGHWVSSFFS